MTDQQGGDRPPLVHLIERAATNAAVSTISMFAPIVSPVTPPKRERHNRAHRIVTTPTTDIWATIAGPPAANANAPPRTTAAQVRHGRNSCAIIAPRPLSRAGMRRVAASSGTLRASADAAIDAPTT